VGVVGQGLSGVLPVFFWKPMSDLVGFYGIINAPTRGPLVDLLSGSVGVIHLIHCQSFIPSWSSAMSTAEKWFLVLESDGIRSFPYSPSMFLASILIPIHLFLFFGGTGDWTQSFAPARQMFYHLSQAPSPFVSSLFFRLGLLLFLRLVWMVIPLLPLPE
jgi:hypothetical protein